MEQTLVGLIESIRINDGSKDAVIVSEMPSKVNGGRIEASKELVFVVGCVDFVRPGARVALLMEFELQLR